MAYRILCAASLLLAVPAITSIQEKGKVDQNPETTEIEQSIAGYTAAYNAADIKALASFWAEDCDFVDHRGRRYTGRDEITALFRKALVDGPGYKIKLTVNARRFLRPDLAMDDGVLE